MANSIAVTAGLRDRWQDAEAHVQALGTGQCGSGQRDAGGEEAVLDHPQLRHTTCLQPFGELDDGCRWEGAVEAHAKVGSGHRGTVPVADHLVPGSGAHDPGGHATPIRWPMRRA